MKQNEQKKTFTLVLEYNDKSEVQAEISVEGEEYENRALLNMIARGTLMASGAQRSYIYDSVGFDVCAYTK